MPYAKRDKRRGRRGRGEGVKHKQTTIIRVLLNDCLIFDNYESQTCSKVQIIIYCKYRMNIYLLSIHE